MRENERRGNCMQAEARNSFVIRTRATVRFQLRQTPRYKQEIRTVSLPYSKSFVIHRLISGNVTQASKSQRISALRPRISTYPASPAAQSCVSYHHSHPAYSPHYTVSFASPSESPSVDPDLLAQPVLLPGIHQAPYVYSQRSSALSTHVSPSCSPQTPYSATRPSAPRHWDSL
jgi:hypothetical protein